MTRLVRRFFIMRRVSASALYFTEATIRGQDQDEALQNQDHELQ